MAEIFVQSSSAIEQVITDLTRLNGEFRTKASEIDSEHSTLVGKWQGDASEAFEEHYRNERQNFDTFAAAVDEYVEGLRKILTEYENAESRNVTIASD